MAQFVLKASTPDAALRLYVRNLLLRAKLHQRTYMESFCERYAPEFGLTKVNGVYVHGKGRKPVIKA